MPNYLKQILHTQLFSILNILFGFITLFILIKYMYVSEYGEYVLIQGFIALAGLIFSQNLYSYTRLYIPGAKKDKQYAYLKTVIIIVFSVYFAIIILLKIFNLEGIIWSFFEINMNLTHLALIMLGLELINLEFIRFFIVIKKIYLKNYIQFFQKLFILISISLLLYFNNLTLMNFLYIFIFGQILVLISLMMAINFKELLYSRFMIDVVKKGYYVAIPLLPIGLMSIALNYTDTLMIAKFVDKEAVAQYGFASQIVAIAMMMIGSSIVLTLFPYATEAHNKNDIKTRTDFFIKMYKYGAILALIFYLLIGLGSNYFINLLDLTKYNNVSSFLYVLAIFPFFQLLYSVSSHYLQLLKVFNIQVYIAFFVIIINIILNYFAIKQYGTIGAAYASLCAYILLAGIYLLISFRKNSSIKKG